MQLKEQKSSSHVSRKSEKRVNQKPPTSYQFQLISPRSNHNIIHTEYSEYGGNSKGVDRYGGASQLQLSEVLTPTNEETRYRLPMASEEKKKEYIFSRNNKDFNDLQMLNA